MKLRSRKRGWRATLAERGEVLIEAAIALPLVGVVVLGLGQQFAVSSAKLEHVKLATEVALGPQEQSLVFDRGTTSFSQLSNSTTPTSQRYLDTVGQFARSRAAAETSVRVVMGYLHVDIRTGRVNGQTVVGTAGTYLGSPAARCSAEKYQAQLVDYAATQLSTMQGFSAPPTPIPTPPGGSPNTSPVAPVGGVAVGAKLYDVRIGATRYQGYVEYMPFIFLSACTEPLFGQLVEPTVSTFTIVPRRLVG